MGQLKIFKENITKFDDIKEHVPDRILTLLFYVPSVEIAKDFFNRVNTELNKVNVVILLNSLPEDNEDFQFPEGYPQVSAFVGRAFLCSLLLDEDAEEFFISVRHLTDGMID